MVESTKNIDQLVKGRVKDGRENGHAIETNAPVVAEQSGGAVVAEQIRQREGGAGPENVAKQPKTPEKHLRPQGGGAPSDSADSDQPVLNVGVDEAGGWPRRIVKPVYDEDQFKGDSTEDAQEYLRAMDDKAKRVTAVVAS